MAVSNDLEGMQRQALMGAPHNIKLITAAVTLKHYEMNALVTTPGSSNYNITLPPMADARGIIFTITSSNAGGGTATVVAGADAPALSTTMALKAAADFVKLSVQSTAGMPQRWVILDSEITA